MNLPLRSSFYINSLEDNLFEAALPREEAKRLFKKYVRDLELENHSYCNRVCWFCPNAFLDRRSANKIMSDHVFEKVISNLGEIDYAGVLEWSGYAEHFAEPSFMQRLFHAREALPNAKPIVFTNGDYLGAEEVREIRRRGIKLHVDVYPPEGEEFNEEKIAAAIAKFTRRTRMETQPVDATVKGWGDYNLSIDGEPTGWRLKVGRYSKENINTRGGALDIPKVHTYRRTAVCMKPVFHLNVHHDGKGMLCCNTRADFAGHADAVIADLNKPEEDLFSFFLKLAPARLALLSPGPKGGVCSTCDDDAEGAPSGLLSRTPINTAIVRTVRKLAGR